MEEQLNYEYEHSYAEATAVMTPRCLDAVAWHDSSATCLERTQMVSSATLVESGNTLQPQTGDSVFGGKQGKRAAT